MSEEALHPDRKVLIDRLVEAGISTRRFLKVDKTKKAFEKGWPDKLYRPEELADYPRWAICGSPPFVLIDADTEEMADNLRAGLPLTFEVRSAIKGLPHFYYKVIGGVIPNKILFSPTTKKPCGEVRSSNYYVVTVGSEVEGTDPPTGKKIRGTYTILNDRPIAEVSFVDFMEAIAPFLGSDPEQKLTFEDIRGGVEEGRRQVTALQYAAFLVNVKGFDKATTIYELKKWDHELNRPPMYEDHELERVVNYCLQHRTFQGHNTSKEQNITNDSHLRILQDPELLDNCLSLLDKLAVGEKCSKILTLLSGISALNKNHNYVNSYRAHGESAIGKSHIIKAVLSLFEQLGVKDWTSASPQALAYLPEDELRHKILYFDEAQGAEEVGYVVRQLQSEGRAKRAIPIRDDKAGKYITIEVEVNGPVCVMTTSINEKIGQESATRTWISGRDKSQAQTENILKHQAEEVMRWVDDDKAIESEIEKLQSAFGMLHPYTVKIWYADKIEFPSFDVRARRDHQRFLGLIMASTLLHQYQRPRDEARGVLFAMPEDYEIAVMAVQEALGTTLLGVTPDAKELLDLIDESDLSGEFTVKKASELWKYGSNKTYKTLEALYAAGYANRRKDGRENIYEISPSNLLPSLKKSLEGFVNLEEFIEYLDSISDESSRDRVKDTFKRDYPLSTQISSKIESEVSPRSVELLGGDDLLIRPHNSLGNPEQKNTVLQVHDLSGEDESETKKKSKTPKIDQVTWKNTFQEIWSQIAGMERSRGPGVDFTVMSVRGAKKRGTDKETAATMLKGFVRDGLFPISLPANMGDDTK